MRSRKTAGYSLPLILSLFFSGLAQAAVTTVTNKADSFNEGNCSLRDAVQSVNLGGNQGGCSFTGGFGSDDTILLEAGDYTLSLPSSDEDNNTDGDIDIIKPLTLRGAGAGSTRVVGAFPAGQEDRIFAVCPNLLCESNVGDTTVQISDLEVSNGGAADLNISGAGLLAVEPFAAASQVLLRLQDCRVSNNLANMSTGTLGGGITGDGADISVARCVVSGNRAFRGGGIITFNGALAIDSSTIEGNQASVSGGGIEAGRSALLLYNSTVNNNSIVSEEFGPSNGGGINFSSACNATAVISNSTISGNQALQRGGGIYVQACFDDLVLSEKLGLTQGQGQSGVFIFNSTIAFNQASGSADGPQAGGGIYFEPNTLNTGVPGAFSVGVYNTILAGNSALNGPDCFDSLGSGGFNLLGDDADCNLAPMIGLPDQINVDPLLGPLQDNGGPTFTHGLSENSPAIDMGNNLPGEGCQSLSPDEVLNNNFSFFPVTADQRAFTRPIAVRNPGDAICDVGAFEFQAFDFTVSKDDGLNGASIQAGESFTYTITVTNNGPGTATAVTLEDPLPEAMDFVAVSSSQGSCVGGASIQCDLGILAAGESASIDVTVIATAAGDYTNIATMTLDNPYQMQVSEAAQVTTKVTGSNLLEGSGFHCGLQPAGIRVRHGSILAFPLIGLALIGVNAWLRRRAAV